MFVTNFKKELTQKEAKVLVILDLQTAHGMDAYVSPAMVMADATKKHKNSETKEKQNINIEVKHFIICLRPLSCGREKYIAFMSCLHAFHRCSY